MPFPDSTKKAPNVFFEVFDSTGSPSKEGFVPAGPTIINPVPVPPPPPPTIYNARWFDPPTQNTSPVTLSNPTDVEVLFPPPPPQLDLFLSVAPWNGIGSSDGLYEMYSANNGALWNSGSTPSPLDGVWADICWSSDLGVAVAISAGNNSGGAVQVMRSTDGINFSPEFLPAGGQNIWWQQVRWAPTLGLFCACSSGTTGSGGGSTDRIATSPDGITWTIQTCPAVDRTWKGMCWSPDLGLFVVIADSGGTTDRIMTSPDGVNWTLGNFGVISNWRHVDWSPGLSLFCAISLDGIVVTSPDGVNWTQTATLANNFWLDLIWVPFLSIFVAGSYLGSPNTIYTSPDGTAWTPRGGGSHGWQRFASNGTTVVGVFQDGPNHVVTSTNGIIWTPAASEATDRSWAGICWAGL